MTLDSRLLPVSSVEYSLLNRINSSAPLTNIQLSKAVNNLINGHYLLKIINTEFNFNDKKWDFRNEIPEKYAYPEKYIISFESLYETSAYYVCLAKLFALELIYKNGIHQKGNEYEIGVVNGFINNLYTNGVYLLDYITTHDIKNYFNSKNLRETTKVQYKRAIKKLFMFYQSATGFEFNNDIYNFLEKYDLNKYNLEREGNKLPLLPTKFMSKLTNLLFDYIKEDKHGTYDRKMAGLLYIETQTGLRPSEIMLLERGCLIPFDIDGIIGYKLQYKCSKSMTSSNEYEIVETIATKNVVKVVKILESLDNEKYLSGNLDKSALNNFLKDFVYNNAEELDCMTAGIDQHYSGKPIEKNGYFINIPLQKQFRVYFATELRQRGYSDMAVASLLNHHDEKMFDYYGRDINDIQENPSFSENIFKDVLLEEVEIIGPKGNAYTDKIKSFIKGKDITVKNNLDAVIADLAKEMPIRQKLGGCCIKPNPNRLCEHDADTDELMCAYGLCQNQVHFYYNLPYYYDQFKDGIKIYKHNREKGYKQQSEKDLYKIHNIINDKLIPEIQSLESFIESKGKSYILSIHPSLNDIIKNLDEIKNEVEIWKNKN